MNRLTKKLSGNFAYGYTGLNACENQWLAKQSRSFPSLLNFIRKRRFREKKGNVKRKKGTTILKKNCRSLYWLGNRDSNPNKQSQSLSCYRYTIPQYAFFLSAGFTRPNGNIYYILKIEYVKKKIAFFSNFSFPIFSFLDFA